MNRRALVGVLVCVLLAPRPASAQGRVSSPGPLLPKPGGASSFFLDRNRGGNAQELVLEELVWGRLVDVHGLDASGSIDPEPVFRDVLVGASIQSDGIDYQMLPSRATQIQRLVVLRGRSTRDFAELVRAAEEAAVSIPARAFDAPSVATVPRNAALGMRFNDLLEDGSAATGALLANVRITLGAPPMAPFPARVLFDENHGGVGPGGFHATRVLVDPTVTEFEADEFATPLPINATGLPPSATSSGASFLLRLPTQLDPGSGQFTLLTNLSGRALATSANAPFDPASPTLDVVRAARAANDQDPDSGFLFDLLAPEVLGTLPVSVTQAVPDPAGTSGFAFLVDWAFTTPCVFRPLVGDALVLADRTLEVVEQGPGPDGSGAVHGVRVRLAQRAPATPAALLGSANLLARLRPGSEASACWFRIQPQPALPPAEGVAPEALFALRFSEPMRVASLDPYEDFRLVRGPAGAQAGALNTVVADILMSSDLAIASLGPVLPLGHTQGSATRYRVELLSGAAGPTDLAGNPLVRAPSAVVRIAPLAPSETSAGIVLRFDSSDEVPGLGADLRGNFFYDFPAGAIRPRPATFFSAAADNSNPVPGNMIPFPPGVQTPLSPFGSKLQNVWRYCDFGWNVRDETKYDVDVVGLNWSPVLGTVITDFFPEFEIRLAHSARLPDEAIDNFLLPRWPNSGLLGAPNPYTSNILEDPLSPQKVVHPRALGYVVSSSDVFVSSTGTTLLPYPLNRGSGPLVSYTWRDTSVQAKGGPNGAGVPTDIEAGAPLFLEPAPGTLAPAGAVPSVGLPLLMEFRCYPTDVGLGLNALGIQLALNSSAQPNFRAFSIGGIDRFGQVVLKDPDLETVPSGGFNPASTPPGLPTQLTAEGSFYIGQLDLVTRISRVHSAWFDTGGMATDYAALRLGPGPGDAPGVTVELRGASGFSGTAGSERDAATLDAYGDVRQGSVSFLNADKSWHASLASIDGARFVQVRLTLANDLEEGTSPELGVLAIAFSR